MYKTSYYNPFCLYMLMYMLYIFRLEKLEHMKYTSITQLLHLAKNRPVITFTIKVFTCRSLIDR